MGKRVGLEKSAEYGNATSSDPLTPPPKALSKYNLNLNVMVNQPESYSYRKGADVIERKGLKDEIYRAVTDAPSIDHSIIQGMLGMKGWVMKAYLLEGTRYVQDAYKDRVLAEIDLKGSLLDSVHRNFLRAQLLFVTKKVDVLVQVVELDRDPKFSNIKRDIELFSPVLTVPILLIGVGSG